MYISWLVSTSGNNRKRWTQVKSCPLSAGWGEFTVTYTHCIVNIVSFGSLFYLTEEFGKYEVFRVI